MSDARAFLERRLAYDERLAREALAVPWYRRVWLRTRLILRKAKP